MKKNQIIFLTYSNTVKEVELLLKTHTNLPIAVRALNTEFKKEVYTTIGKDRPQAIIYDNRFDSSGHMKDFHEDLLTALSVCDSDCIIYSFEKPVPLRGVELLTVEKLKVLVLEPI